MFRLTSSAEKFQSHDALRAALEKLRREVLLLLSYSIATLLLPMMPQTPKVGK